MLSYELWLSNGLRILWRCWQTRQDYDQEKYLQQLEKRRSPIAARARQLALEMAA